MLRVMESTKDALKTNLVQKVGEKPTMQYLVDEEKPSNNLPYSQYAMYCLL